MSFFDKFPYTNFHELNLDWALAQIKTISINTMKAIESAKNAKQSEDNAKTSETNAKKSETNASASASSASTSASNARTSSASAKISEENASRSASSASASANNASTSASNASTSETNASASAKQAKTSETNASASANKAKTSETNAKTSETKAQASASTAQSVASSVSSTVYYYESPNYNTSDNNSMLTSLRIIAKNGLLILTGKCRAINKNSEGFNIKAVNSSVIMFGSVTHLGTMKDVNNGTPITWLNSILPNIDWQNIKGSGVVASSYKSALPIKDSTGASATMDVLCTGGIRYEYSNNDPVLLSDMAMNFAGRINERLEVNAENLNVDYSMVIPLKFK